MTNVGLLLLPGLGPTSYVRTFVSHDGKGHMSNLLSRWKSSHDALDIILIPHFPRADEEGILLKIKVRFGSSEGRLEGVFEFPLDDRPGFEVYLEKRRGHVRDEIVPLGCGILAEADLDESGLDASYSHLPDRKTDLC